MSFLKKLFGGGSSGGDSTPKVLAEVEHEGFLIQATPTREADGQFRIVGIISREKDGERRQHRLIRADLFSSADEAAEATIRKARQVIAEQGERIFN